MIEWIDKVLTPYVEQFMKMLPDESDKIYLIMDNCGIHNSANVRRKWQTLERLELVWFPPHTSHFLQMDGSMFGALKSMYRNLRTPKTTPKLPAVEDSRDARPFLPHFINEIKKAAREFHVLDRIFLFVSRWDDCLMAGQVGAQTRLRLFSSRAKTCLHR